MIRGLVVRGIFASAGVHSVTFLDGATPLRDDFEDRWTELTQTERDGWERVARLLEQAGFATEARPVTRDPRVVRRCADAIARALEPLLEEHIDPQVIAATLLSFGAGFALRLWSPDVVREAQAAALSEHSK